MGYRVGVDIGGTFTDLCAFDEATGVLHTMKVFSRPDQPGADVAEGVRMLHERYGIAPSEITHFTHGTTVGINAIIQRRGIDLCLVTTENFGDVLEVARLKMPDPYDLLSRRPDTLIPRDRVVGLAERIMSDGSVDLAPTEAAMAKTLADARAAGAQGIVISLLHSYRNPAHEIAFRDYLAQHAPDLPVFCSHEVWPIIREYERTITAVLHGYVQPRVSFYIDALQKALADSGVPAAPMLTKSNGGLMRAEAGKKDCAQMLLSGTASGVVGAALIAGQTGLPRVMSVDIGGTSADVAVIRDGVPTYGVGEIIGDFPIYIPSVSVTSIGGGGGSIAALDEFGLLSVGPESAGSTPGPACYSRGGDRPTITDALVVMGFLGLADLGYDQFKLDHDAARAAVDTVARGLARPTEDAAEAIVAVAVSDMHLEISKLLSRDGIDPKTISLMAFGGAGPMLTCFLAKELGVSTVVVPPSPGVLAALGGLVSDMRNDFISTLYADLDETLLPKLEGELTSLEREARAWLIDEQQFTGSEIVVSIAAEMRYAGQSFEIEVPFANRDAALDIEAVKAAFHARHHEIYDYSDPTARVQIIALRLTIAGIVPKPSFPVGVEAPHEARPERMVEVFLDGARRQIPMFRRDTLTPGARFTSPAVVVQSDTTSCIPAGFTAHVDIHSNLIVTRNA